MDEETFNMSVRRFLKKLGVTAQREIELAVRACPTGLRVGAAHDSHHEVARGEAATGRGLAHSPERLVSQHEPLPPGRGPAEVTRHDLGVCAADADRQPVHEQLALAGPWLLHIDHGGRAGLARDHGQRAHAFAG